MNFSFLHSFFAFILILIPLVVFHEFGHFIFAKLFGVKAEIFSVGFGPKLWSYQKGETEFRLSAIPMGGYVKLLGEDRESELPDNEKPRALYFQKPWKRFFIFFGGPLFNFILAIFIFMVVLVVGEEHIGNTIGRVAHGSAAEAIGFKSGDQVLEIDGKEIHEFEQIHSLLIQNPGKTLTFKVLRSSKAQADQSPILLEVPITATQGMNLYGESTLIGEINGIFPMARQTELGVSDPLSIAAKRGLKTGDKITQLNGVSTPTWEVLEFLFDQVPLGSPFSLKVERGSGVKQVQLEKPVAKKISLEEAYGLFSSELFIEKVIPHSPAESIGMQSGDRLIAVGNRIIQSFFSLKSEIQRLGEQSGSILVRWEHDGKIRTESLTPSAASRRDSTLKQSTQYTIGVVPMLSLAEPVKIVEKIWNPFRLIQTATSRMVSLSWRNFVSLKKMFLGAVSMGNLGGPFTIGKIAGESLSHGFTSFLTHMALFSIGLGVLNILPIPVLDGGHLLLLGFEILRGKALSLRQTEVAQGLGIVFILVLMGVSFFNDILRLFYS